MLGEREKINGNLFFFLAFILFSLFFSKLYDSMSLFNQKSPSPLAGIFLFYGLFKSPVEKAVVE